MAVSSAKDNRRPAYTLEMARNAPRRDVNRIVLPPASFQHERDKIERRWPAAVQFIRDHQLNEHFGPASGAIGIILQGGMFNAVLRALQQLGLADIYGTSRVPLYVLNFTYPLIEDEIVDFCRDKRAVLIVEEGQPEFIEQAVNTILRRGGVATAISGKDVLPRAGEYTATVLLDGITGFIEQHDRRLFWATGRRSPSARAVLDDPAAQGAGRRRFRRARPASAPAARSGRSSPP